jgi:hypothetical protein
MRYRLLLLISLAAVFSFTHCSKKLYKNTTGAMAVSFGDSLINFDIFALHRFEMKSNLYFSKMVAPSVAVTLRCTALPLFRDSVTQVAISTSSGFPALNCNIVVAGDQVVGSYRIDEAYPMASTIVLDEVKANGRCLKGRLSYRMYLSSIDTTWGEVPYQYFPDTITATNVPFTIEG